MHFSFPSGREAVQEPFKYYKREGNRFFFQNKFMGFDLELTGKDLYDFVDRHDLGDLVIFDVPLPRENSEPNCSQPK